MNDWIYSEEVKDHFFHPRNVLFEDESLFKHNARGIAGNVVCGDQMLMLLRIEDNTIKDIRWKTYGCASAIASTSALSEMVKGMTLDQALAIKAEDVAEHLGGLPKKKFHCSVLGSEALKNAIENYQNSLNG
ncbi:MAG: iron-sulfur cluster assembly scaffold protein [Candidatus Nomurabacteria bacterium]|jgi:nitrogen fixation NifU-like protein|nr:iron-sulfur cluster assembly scaffold protein [Candidatus Nomurabacteria bacterium]